MAKNFNYDEVPVVETTGGRLKGFLYEGAYIYRGVPYAYAVSYTHLTLPTKA